MWNCGGATESAKGACRARRLSYWHHPGSEPLLPLTLGQVAERAAAAWPEREAVVAVHQDRRLTFRQVLEQADQLAAGLLDIGLQPGDMMGLCEPNSMEWYITNLAAARAGVILVNINPAYQISELEYCLKKAEVKALIIPDKFRAQNYYKMIEHLAPELTLCEPGKLESARLPHLQIVITISETKLPGALRYADLMRTDSAASRVRQMQEKIQPDWGCNLQFTSGTTGQPKGTLLSHHSIVNSTYFIGKRLAFNKKHHRICLQVPLFHAFGNLLGVIIALHCGSTLVVPSYTFRAEDAINSIKQERCTILYGTPTMFIDVISKSQEYSDVFSSLESALVAGSPLHASLFHRIVKTFSLKQCFCVYGMTETGSLTFVPGPDDTKDICANTVGFVMDHFEVKVVNKKGAMLPMGQPGELLVRGYGNMLKYYNDEDRTKEVMGYDRWMRTGDLFVLRDDGYGEVVGRIKDMIIRGGENIFPKMIEDYLLTHKEVEDAQVIGIPDERLGEEICACIRLAPGSTVTKEELTEFCKGKIAYFNIPKYFKFMSNYPRTQSGKVQKYKLREIVLKNGFD